MFLIMSRTKGCCKLAFKAYKGFHGYVGGLWGSLPALHREPWLLVAVLGVIGALIVWTFRLVHEGSKFSILGTQVHAKKSRAASPESGLFAVLLYSLLLTPLHPEPCTH